MSKLWPNEVYRSHHKTGTDDPYIKLPVVISSGAVDLDSHIALSLLTTPFRMRVRDSTLFAQNPLDCFLLPIIFECSVHVDSTCPADGNPIQISITPEGISSSYPVSCVVSLPIFSPGAEHVYDNYSEIFNRMDRTMRFLSSPSTASLWTVAYPGLVTLTLVQTWELALSISRQFYR